MRCTQEPVKREQKSFDRTLINAPRRKVREVGRKVKVTMEKKRGGERRPDHIHIIRVGWVVLRVCERSGPVHRPRPTCLPCHSSSQGGIPGYVKRRHANKLRLQAPTPQRRSSGTSLSVTGRRMYMRSSREWRHHRNDEGRAPGRAGKRPRGGGCCVIAPRCSYAGTDGG